MNHVVISDYSCDLCAATKHAHGQLICKQSIENWEKEVQQTYPIDHGIPHSNRIRALQTLSMCLSVPGDSNQTDKRQVVEAQLVAWYACDTHH